MQQFPIMECFGAKDILTMRNLGKTVSVMAKEEGVF